MTGYLNELASKKEDGHKYFNVLCAVYQAMTLSIHIAAITKQWLLHRV